MKKLKIVILACLTLILIAGCVEQSRADSGRFTKIVSEETNDGFIYVYHDNANNVTVYMWGDYSGYGYSGMSAIPDWQLEEPKNEISGI